MRRAKSRNFILAVCGVLITLLLGLVLAKTIVNVLNDINRKNTDEEIEKNILSSSSKIKLSGRGNFIDSTPKIDKTAISEFNIRLAEANDEVYYSISFCNMNDMDVKYKDLIVEAVSCFNGTDIDNCNDVSIDTYVVKHNKRLKKGDVISANSCVDLVINAKYVGNNSFEREVSISRVVLEFGSIKR